MHRISLIGMADTGKSYWANKLAAHGFKCYSCDDLIADRLSMDCGRVIRTKNDMGMWMGFPDEPGYGARESRFLSHERQVMLEILDDIEGTRGCLDQKMVVDTGGSVIYTGEDILARLKGCTRIVHLSTPLKVQERMLRAYIAKPGPMLWRGLFKMEPGETKESAFARCYRKLLESREKLYKQYADLSIDYDESHQTDLEVDHFLRLIKEKMG